MKSAVVCMYIPMFVCMYVRMYVCMHIIYIYSDTQVFVHGEYIISERVIPNLPYHVASHGIVSFHFLVLQSIAYDI